MFAQMNQLAMLDTTDRALRRTCTANGQTMSMDIEKKELGYINTIRRRLELEPIQQEDLFLIVTEHDRGGLIDNRDILRPKVIQQVRQNGIRGQEKLFKQALTRHQHPPPDSRHLKLF